MNVGDTINKFSESCIISISSSIKNLLETKHLYQSVSLDFNDILAKIIQLVPDKTSQAIINGHVKPRINAAWIPAEVAKGSSFSDEFIFKAPDVKLFCSKCNRIEAFNMASTEVLPYFGRHYSYLENGKPIQLFSFSFVCQSCKGVPEVFLVRREGFKLILSGRTPIERVEVPTVIPKNIRKYYSDAIVAHQSGQTLAGNFLFRCLIEQWVISLAAAQPDSADKAIDEYMSGLPKDFNSRFPSLRTLYGELSVDIHRAVGSSDLHEKAQSQIVEHFEARRLFKL